MGDCSKCTSTPSTSILDVIVFLCVGSDHLYSKALHILKLSKYKFDIKDKYFIISVHDFSVFIKEIDKMTNLSSVEKNDIYLLPLKSKDDLNFGEFPNSKSLNYWIYFYENLDIISSIKNERISTLFQPLFENKSLKLYSHEALSRAFSENNQVIAPSRLFAASKKLGLLFNLDRQCRIGAIRNAYKQNLSNGKLFINFIPSIIYDPEVCLKTTHEAIKNTNLQPKDIVFEIVESEFIEDYTHLGKILKYYKSKGYKTALDDIGSGYSTLSKYEVLRTDYIKLDVDLIRDIHISSSSQAYLQRVLELKKKYGFKIVAEGIETKEEYEFIKNTDVDIVQGFYFSKPKVSLFEDEFLFF